MSTDWVKSILQPLPHQVEGVHRMEALNGRVLLADDMGLGKTFQLLAALQRNPSWLPAVVLCPTAVKYNWAHEARAYFGLSPNICEGRTPKESVGGVRIRHDITIINYDILPYWVEKLLGLGIKTLIADESQYLSNLDAKRTQAAIQLSASCRHVICSSGTPMEKSPRDFFPTLHMLWPHEFKSFSSYAERYCNPQYRPWGWDFSGSANLDELNTRVNDLGIIRRKKSILNLPQKARRMVRVEIDNPAEYHFAANDFMAWLEQNLPHKVRKVKRNEKLSKIGFLLRLCSKLKLRASVNKMNHFLQANPGKKLVAFGVHRKALEVVSKHIKGKHVVIHGGVTGKDRQAAIDQFQTDPDTVAAIGNIRAAGVGTTMTAAQRLVFFEFWWNPSLHLQAEDRIHRIGQRLPCVIDYYTAAGTIEEKVCELLQKRQQAINQAVDGDVDAEEYNLHEDLLDLLEERLI